MYRFFRRKRSTDLAHARVRRLLDLTAGRTIDGDDPRRSTTRYGRTLPVLLVPWQDDAPLVDAACFAVTRNISDGGFGLILTEPFRHPRVCLAIYIPDDPANKACFFLANCKHLTSIGGGYWTLGIELTDYASDTCPEKLGAFEGLAAHLQPESGIPDGSVLC